MAINKVIVNRETKLDLTADTVTVDDVKQGVTFHDASGVKLTGNAKIDGVDGLTIVRQEIPPEYAGTCSVTIEYDKSSLYDSDYNPDVILLTGSQHGFNYNELLTDKSTRFSYEMNLAFDPYLYIIFSNEHIENIRCYIDLLEFGS